MNPAITVSRIERKPEPLRQTVVVTGGSAANGPEIAGTAIDDRKDISEIVIYLTHARYVTAEVLHMDGDAHMRRW